MPIPRQPEKGALETIREASRKLSDEDEIVRPCRKRQEPGRNDLTLSSDRQQLAYAYLGVDCFAPHAREGMFKLPKFGESPQARTIPSQARQRREGVETREEALERGDSIVRTAWQHAESDRNALTS